jgi:thiol-disulfide isomerase/thioredoxin
MTATAELPIEGGFPQLGGATAWLNSEPLTPAGLRGKVVVVQFCTFSCINWLRTVPYVKAWAEKYRDDGLVVIGVHSPEFPFERDAENVDDAIRRNQLRYPVVQDNEFATWNAYGNQYWPAKYLIDSRGRVRYTHFGEGAYGETEDAIRALLAEAGSNGLGRTVKAQTDGADAAATPESYLGAARADRFLNGLILPGRHPYGLPQGALAHLPLHHLAYEGEWRIRGSHAVAGPRARLHIRFRAQRVFLVLGTPAGTREVAVWVDGRAERTVEVREHRLYELVELPRRGAHLLTLRMQPGTEAYAFTFG